MRIPRPLPDGWRRSRTSSTRRHDIECGPCLRPTILTIALLAIGAALMPAAASAQHEAQGAAPAVLQQQTVDDNDDTRVEVQVTVLAVAVGVVVVLGTLLYFLRKRLGLVPPPPDPEAAGAGHH